MDPRVVDKVKVSQEEANKCIIVSNIPPGNSSDKLTIHFQKTKHGGGDIISVSFIDEETAAVVFEESETVRSVLSNEQNFQGKTLKVESYSQRMATKEEVNEETALFGALEGDQEQRSIVVRSLPPGIDEQKITIHFQKRRHGGGDIESVNLLGRDVAVVTFDEQKTVETCLGKKQLLGDKELVVTPYTCEREKKHHHVEEDGPLLDFVDEDQAARSIVIRNLPQDINRETVLIHFQRKKNGGGDIEEVKIASKEIALVIFEEPDTVSTALSHKQILNGVALQVYPAQKVNSTYEVYSEVTANLNTSAFAPLNDTELEQLMKRVEQELHVRVEKKAGKFLLSGKFLQVMKSQSLLQKFLSDKECFVMVDESFLHENESTSKSSSIEDQKHPHSSERNKTKEIPAEKDDSGIAALSMGTDFENKKVTPETQTFETTPLIIRFTRKIYSQKLEIIEEEFSVRFVGSSDDTKITIQPLSNCNEHKYNDACSEFIELYRSVIQGVTKSALNINPETKVSNDTVRSAIRKAEKSLPVLIEKVQKSNEWTIFGDRDSVSAAKEKIQQLLGIPSEKEKSRRRRSPATQVSQNDTVNTPSSLPADEQKNALEHYSKTGIRVSVLQGDITQENVDAVVNPANTALNMSQGLGKAIVKKGGSSIQDEAEDRIKKGSVKPGNVILTKAGSLPCKYVIHAVGPMDWPGRSPKNQKQVLLKAYLESFHLAQSLKLKSVAVPAIGTGATGAPLDVCANQLFNAIEEFWSNKKEVKEIRIVNLSDDAHEAFKKEFTKRFKSGPSKSAKKDGDNGTTKTNEGKSKPQQSPDNHDQASSSKTEKSDDKCVICIEAPTNPVTLDKCGHTFCRDCIDQAFSHRKVCPTCGTVYGILTGNQPRGTMNWNVDTYNRLPGYERYGTIRINYFFPDGTQGPEHPTPGQRYYGTSRTAFLPDCPEGKEVLKLLKRAFDARLIFTIGTSVTTGFGNVVTWNDIHHKTNIHGGSTGYGYPDPTYLSRVKEELAAKGIV